MKKFKEIMVVCVKYAIGIPCMIVRAVGYILETLLMALGNGIKEVITGNFLEKLAYWEPCWIRRKHEKQREQYEQEARILAYESAYSGESMNEYCRKLEELRKKYFK